MAKREAALSGGDGGIVSVATCKDSGHKRIELSVVASESEAIERLGIPNKKRAQSYGEATAQRRFEDCVF